MFEGLGFRILTVLMTVLTVVLGVMCVVAGWVKVILDQHRTASMKVPYALYTLTLSVLFQLAGLLVLLRVPYDLTERSILRDRSSGRGRSGLYGFSFCLPALLYALPFGSLRGRPLVLKRRFFGGVPYCY